MSGFSIAYAWRPEWGRCEKSGKRNMPTLKIAKVHARFVGASYYQCPHCKEYHLTHHTKKVQRAIAASLRSAR